MAIEILNSPQPAQHPLAPSAPAHPVAPAHSAPPVPPAPAHTSMPHTAVTTLQRESPDVKGSWNPYLLAVGIIGLVVTLVVSARYLYVRQQITSFNTTITTLQSEYAGLQETETEANNIKSLSDALSSVYQSQVNYTGLLKKLEETTYNGTRYISLSLDSTGQVTLSGKTGSYLDFAKVVKSFKEKGTTAAITPVVAINSVGQELAEQPDGSKVREILFSLSFTLDNTLLLPVHSVSPSALMQEDAAATDMTTTSVQTETTTLPEGTL